MFFSFYESNISRNVSVCQVLYGSKTCFYLFENNLDRPNSYAIIKNKVPASDCALKTKLNYIQGKNVFTVVRYWWCCHSRHFCSHHCNPQYAMKVSWLHMILCGTFKVWVFFLFIFFIKYVCSALTLLCFGAMCVVAHRDSSAMAPG